MSLSNSNRRQAWRRTTNHNTPALWATWPCITPAMAGTTDPPALVFITSPIKHVIILVGETRGFDHTFATYTPAGKGQTISNLLSKGIVNADGSPGPNYALAQQYSVAPQPLYYMGAPDNAKTPYNTTTNPMPQPTTGGAPSGPQAWYPFAVGYSAPFEGPDQDPNWALQAQLVSSEDPDIKASQFNLLSEGWSNLPNGVLDTRIPGAGSLAGPFPLQGPDISEHDYTGDQTHRFFPAAQQQDCSMENATTAN